MPEGVEVIVRVVLIGAGATALLDLWSLFATRVLGMPAPNWARHPTLAPALILGLLTRKDASCTRTFRRQRPSVASG